LFLILFSVFFILALIRLIIRRRRLNQMRAQRGEQDVIILERPEPTYQYSPYQGGYYQNPPGQAYSQPYYSAPQSSSTPPPAYNPQGYPQPYYYPPNNPDTQPRP